MNSKLNIMTEDKKNLWQKMSEIQGLSLDIGKDKKAHGYSYATLDQIMDKLSPLLHKHKLLLYHETGYDNDKDKAFLKTIVRDIEKPDNTLSSMTYLEKEVKLPGQNQIMVVGSQITYYRRYHVSSLFGLTTEEDNDAGGAKPVRRGKSPENAGVQKEIDFVNIFQGMIDKGKTKAVVMKQFTSYKEQMNETQIKTISSMLNKMK